MVKFKIHDNGKIGLNIDNVKQFYKYGIIFKDDSEIHLPQTLMRKLIKQFGPRIPGGYVHL